MNRKELLCLSREELYILIKSGKVLFSDFDTWLDNKLEHARTDGYDVGYEAGNLDAQYEDYR